jgi:hypothetical protein
MYLNAGWRGALRLASIVCLAGAIFGSGVDVSWAQANPARAAVARAAVALGGLERIRAIRNITLQGYGQYAYMFGGGNITGDPAAPQKFEAANELRRIYDLETGRYQQRERRNFLFPFAITNGHDYHQVIESLDGDVAFNITPDGKSTRISRWKEDAHQMDGVHMRRMWNVNNPIVAVRKALAPGSKLTLGKPEAGATVVNVAIPEGDRFAMGLDARSHLPLWVRWTNPMTNLGQVTLTTHLTGYTPHSGFMLPLGYTTYMDWRHIPYLRMFVDAYVIDGEIPNLAAPDATRAMSDAFPEITITAKVIAPHIWRLSSGTTVFEFSNHLTLYELNSSKELASATIKAARKLVPGKPVTQVIASHQHFDHVAGIRTAVAEGLTVISRRNNEGILREMINHPAPDYPDDLARRPRPMTFIPVDEHLRLSDSMMTVDLYWDRDNTHMAEAIFAYAPSAKLVAEADMATAAYDYQWWPDNYMDNVEHYHLDVALLSPVHSIWPEHPDILTQAQVIELITGGVQRARARCAAELAKGNYFPGCPVQTRRY